MSNLFKLVPGEYYEIQTLHNKIITGKMLETYWNIGRLGIIVENLVTGFNEYIMTIEIEDIRYAPHIRISMLQAKKDLKKLQETIEMLKCQCEHELTDPMPNVDFTTICRDCGLVQTKAY